MSHSRRRISRRVRACAWAMSMRRTRCSFHGAVDRSEQHRGIRRAGSSCLRNRWPACRRRRNAGLRSTTPSPSSQPSGGASNGSGAGSRCRCGPRLTISRRSSCASSEKAQHERRRSEHRAVEVSRAAPCRAAGPPCAAGSDRDAAAAPRRASRDPRSRVCSAGTSPRVPDSE